MVVTRPNLEGAVINAALNIPENWEIDIEITKECVEVKLYDETGNQVKHDHLSPLTADRVMDALKLARCVALRANDELTHSGK